MKEVILKEKEKDMEALRVQLAKEEQERVEKANREFQIVLARVLYCIILFCSAFL